MPMKVMIKDVKPKVSGWLTERLGIEEVLHLAQKKTVPVHKHTFWYYWGGLSLFFFLVQAITGVLLLIYYRPGPDAYESVRQITFDINFGWLIRSAHSWAANLMIVAIFIHMFSVFFMKAYRRPREFGWFSGVVLLLVTMVFGFSGYLLPMNELAYFATKVGLEMPAALPVIGPKMADLVRGGSEVGEFTVQRFFALHVVVLPAIFLGAAWSAPLARPETWQRRAPERGGHARRGKNNHAFLSQLPGKGPGHVAHRPQRAGPACFHVPMGTRQPGRRPQARAQRTFTPNGIS